MTATFGRLKDLHLNPYELLDLAITAQLAIIEDRPIPAWLCDQPVRMLMEYRTIAVAGHRQVGKTEWIIRHASSRSLVLIGSTVQAEQFKRRWAEYHGPDVTVPVIMVDKPRCRIYQQLEAIENTLGTFDNLFIDDASYFFRACDQKKLYAHVARLLDDTSLCFLIG